jgi:hypothetical protein
VTLFVLVLLFMPLFPAMATGLAGTVEKILREVRQDQPVPSVDYLKKGEPVNIDCTSYRGDYQGVRISVETHPNSQRVSSVLLEIAGPDRTKEILPAVKRVIGPPRTSSPKQSQYSWEWPKYRTASLHYVRGKGPGEGLTVVSLFYR